MQNLLLIISKCQYVVVNVQRSLLRGYSVYLHNNIFMAAL